MSPQKQLSFVLLLVVLTAKSINADVFAECTQDKANQFVASSKSCKAYIFCDGEESYDGECGDGDYFNELYQTCDPADIVDCWLDNLTTTTTRTTSTAAATTTTAPTTTTTTTATTAATTTTATTSTSRPATSAFSELTPQISTQSLTPLTPTTTTNPTTAISMLSCPARDQPGVLVFLPHPKSCSSYYICFHGEPIEMQCSAMLHFDMRKGSCDYPANVRCKLDHLKPKEQCQPNTTDLYAHPDNCNYFYFCRNGYLMLQQCPFHFGWDFEKRVCVSLKDAKCYGKRNML